MTRKTLRIPFGRRVKQSQKRDCSRSFGVTLVLLGYLIFSALAQLPALEKFTPISFAYAADIN
jgi:hypothetical protein